MNSALCPCGTSWSARLAWVLCALALSLGACSADEGKPKPSSTSDASGETGGDGAILTDGQDDAGDGVLTDGGATVDPDPVSKTIGDEGGTIENSSGAGVKVPAGALPAGVELTLEAAQAPTSVAAIGTAMGPALVLGPEGQTFLVPVEIALPIDPALLDGIDPATELQVVLAPGGGGEFVGLETTWDPAGKRLLAKTTHFSIAVPVKLKGPPLTLDVPTLPQPKVGDAYGPVALTASGGSAPYTFSLAGGSLPPGIALSPSGSLSGTPLQAGKFAPTVRVRDQANQALDKALALEIDGPPNAKPVVVEVSPASVQAGSGATELTVSGKDFAFGALVLLGGKGVPTTRVSDTVLQVMAKPALLAQVGKLSVAVVNPPPGGGTSSAIELQIDVNPSDDAVGSDADAGGDSDSAEDASDADTSPPCVPTVPATEVCDGVDNDCDGKTDDNLCSDGQVCTTGDACKGAGAAATCAGGGPLDCEDGNPCTTDSCDAIKGCVHAPAIATCSDGLACTVGDACDNGSCKGGAMKDCADGDACTLDGCDAATGTCTNAKVAGCGAPCVSAANCQDDGNPCTDAACKLGLCTLLDAVGACDDGDVCTEADACKGGACHGDAKGCDDGDACTVDACAGATGCSHKPKDGGPCSDGDACSTQQTCQAGACKGSGGAAGSIDCNDGNPCTTDSCDKVAGCVATPANGACDDGDPCTVNDACSAGTCGGGGAKNCDDNDSCTLDTCVAATGGCDHAAVSGCGASCVVDGDCKVGTDPCVGLQCASGACALLAKTGPCDDSDACTQGDACKDGVCLPGAASPCDDGDACTDDACDSKAGCVSTPNTASCSDGKQCTVGDACNNGGCAGGKPLNCNDGQPCTVDSCVEGQGCTHLPSSGECDDGNACTVGEGCKGGACKDGTAKDCGDGDDCTLDACDVTTGACASTTLAGCGAACAKDADCQGGANWCSPPVCTAGKCAISSASASCDDGDPCTSGDACQAGLCVGQGKACDDGNPCTVDACGAGGACVATTLIGLCSDGNACTISETCKQGICVSAASLDCNDDNACTDDSCDPKLGCQHLDSKTPCSDGDPCTLDDACKDAKCQGLTPKVCDDGDACTTDACDLAGSCTATIVAGCGEYCDTAADCKDDGNVCTDWACTASKCALTFTSASCDDGDACTKTDVCKGGKCAGTKVICDDANPCSDDSCDPKSGCAHAANTAPCSDGKVCTAGDSCKDKACIPGPISSCDDGNPCTFDLCDALAGCLHPAAGMACTDGDPCTVGDVCQGGACKAGTLLECDDGNPCTFDVCLPKVGKCASTQAPGCGIPCASDQGCVDTGDPCANLGCVEAACQVTETGAGCTDDNACTTGDACKGGTCRGKGGDCNDGNACTADACNVKTGCSHGSVDGLCEDGNLCTVQDACAGGACQAGPSQQCADGNPCTQDGCDAKVGCQFAAISGGCSDGNGCTVGDGCQAGLCLPGAVTSCDDADTCTLDTCDAKTGACGHKAVAGCGASCTTQSDCQDDGNPCTTATCSSGVCGLIAATAACDDGNACTNNDVCTGGACHGVALVKSCDDGNPCTDDGCDPKIGCGHVANTAPCTLGNACVTKAICSEGGCKASGTVNCDDGNACTRDQCNPQKGCSYTATAAPCDDGSPCTLQDECDQGICKGGVAKACNDGQGCTLDQCDQTTGGCVFTSIKGCGAPCKTTADCQDDGNACTQAICAGTTCVAVFVDVPCDDNDACSSGDSCASGVCSGTAAACDDGNACTVDSCDSKGNCSHKTAQGGCSDGSACTTGDVCTGGLCAGGALLACNDGNPCTTDSCDAKLGCKSTPSKAACEDGNPCTVGDACIAGACAPGKPKLCDDGKPCTLDVCSVASGLCTSAAVTGCGASCSVDGDCAHPAGPCVALGCDAGACALALPATACDDGDACTKGDACVAGLCVAAVGSCDDKQLCTADACDPSKGCVHAPISSDITLSCDDGNACTTGDVCADGTCAAGQPIVCKDANPCTDDTCDPATGCVALPNKVTCDDDNVCTVDDSCVLGYCTGTDAKDCNDGNPCTYDVCATGSGCAHPPAPGPCEDGDACTSNDACDKGGCKGGGPTTCDDANVCTTDGCDKLKGCTKTPKAGSCNDGSACTQNDLCIFGQCFGGKNVVCDDGKPCTLDACDPAVGCLATEVTGTCDDGDACTADDSCAKGACKPGAPLSCDDGHPCTTDACDKVLGCTHKLANNPCSDGNACTGPDVCLAGKCSAGPPIACDDSNVCTDDACDKVKGCVHLALSSGDGNVAACTDGDACTGVDNCKDGGCAPGNAPVCDDNNVCTDDSCDKVKGCVNLANSTTCTDDDACTVVDVCKDGSCKAGAPRDCDDAKVCTDDSCDAKAGCKHAANTGSCSDGNACTSGDACSNGACVSGKAVVCDDGKPCTFDSCDPASGCGYANSLMPCDDGDACTAPDACAGGACVAGKAVDCDDGNACTSEACDKAKGCVTTQLTDVCDDGDACTKGDACGKGACAAGAGLNCDDGEFCTADSCDQTKGCVNLPTTATCTDGDACSGPDVCKAGTCRPGPAAKCDDGNACTDDSCDKASGCKHAANTAPCSDGDACTVGDACASAACKGSTRDCDDGNACTTDSCDKVKGCTYASSGATSCSDGDACSSGDACDGTSCKASGKIDCADGSDCTFDVCDSASGCKHKAVSALCDDGESCTTDSCDAQTGCKHVAASDGASCTSLDPCVTTPVCLSGVCKNKPVVASVTTPSGVKSVAAARNNDGYLVGMAAYPGTVHRVRRLDNDLATVWEWSATGNGVARVRTLDGSLWGDFFASGVLVLAGSPSTLLRLNDGNGSVVWSKSNLGYSFDFVQTSSGLALVDSNDPGTFRWANQNGDLAGSRSIPAKMRAIIRTGEGVFIAGDSAANGTRQLWVSKVSNEGVASWQQNFGSGNAGSYAFALGGLAAFGSDAAYNPQSSEIVRFNNNGSFSKRKTGLHAPGTGDAEQIFLVDGGQGLWFGGGANVSGKGWMPWIGKLDGNDNVVWSKVFGDKGGRVRDLALGKDVVVGGDVSADSTGFLWKVSSNGEIGAPACTATNLCQGKTCDDGKACTKDSCDPQKGCQVQALDALCDDGKPCTADSCDAATGCVNASGGVACDDSNACTTDACDPAKGCVHTDNTASCDDGDACTVGDICQGGSCKSGGAKNCEDGIACTAHSCDKAAGCKQTADAKKCDDGDACTANNCVLGTGCVFAPDAGTCDDGNVCTADLCAGGKCSHLDNAAVCDDGNACTVADGCKGGVCKAGVTKLCDDLNACTDDACNPQSGCTTTAKSAGTSCTPSASCAVSATCNGAGECQDGPLAYFVTKVSAHKGEFKVNTMAAIPGGGIAYVANDHTGDSTATLRRADDFGATVWEQTLANSRIVAVDCRADNGGECVFAGGNSNNGVVVTKRAAANGSQKSSWEQSFGTGSRIVALAYDSDWNDYGAAVEAGGDAYIVRVGNSTPEWSYKGAGNEIVGDMLFNNKTGGHLLVGSTNTQGAGGYDGFWFRVNNPPTVIGGAGDDYFSAVAEYGGKVWVGGSSSDTPGGSLSVTAWRIEGGLVTKKFPQFGSLGSSDVGINAVGADAILTVRGGVGRMARIDVNGDTLWTNTYTLPNLNGGLVAAAPYAGGILAMGSATDGSNGSQVLTMVRTDADGIASCSGQSACAGKKPGDCDDGVACTGDSCDVQKGCVHVGDNALCNDGNPCTLNVCDEVKGCLFPQNSGVPCDDGKPCTVDVCDVGAKACRHTLDPAKACDDGKACTTDLCDGGGQCSHDTLNCDDSNPCTTELCDVQKGCQYTNLVGQPCSDGKPCTIGDVCSNGGSKAVCTPVTEICTPAVPSGLLLHVEASVAGSVVVDGSNKVSTWSDVATSAKGLDAPFASKPVLKAGVVFGREGVDLASSGMRWGWNNPGSFTVAIALAQGNPDVGGTLFATGAWRAIFVGGKLQLLHHSPPGPETVAAAIALDVGKAYLMVVRVASTTVHIAVQGTGSPAYAAGVAQGTSAGAQELWLGKINANGQDGRATIGALQVFGRALEDAEVIKLLTRWRSDFGLAACQQNTDCDDGNDCTIDLCDQPSGGGRVCKNEPKTDLSKGVCKDANPCTVDESCENGVCVGTTTKVCDDSNPCTVDTCDLATGNCKSTIPEGKLSCDDGNPCTVPDTCSSGSCLSYPKVCDDGNPCTDDSCNPANGACVATPNKAPCDDGNICTSADTCSNGTCTGGHNNAVCDDGNKCTTDEHCKNGGCNDVKPIVCKDDGNPCTVEKCSIHVGCVYTTKACDDGNPCTDDNCDLQTGGCASKANQAGCNDGSACSFGDHCQDGKCKGGVVLDCDDGSICTADGCDSASGCTHKAVSDCDDGNACTEKDFCVFGTCLPGGPPNCDDGNPCTIDACDVATGCKHTVVADATACSDGVACTVGDACTAGSCIAGATVCDYAVTSTSDAGAGTLRQAMVEANGAQQAEVNAQKTAKLRTIGMFVSGVIKLQTDLPELDYPITIDGRDATVVIDGGGERAIFSSLSDLTVRRLKLYNAYRGKGDNGPFKGAAISVVRPFNEQVGRKLIVEDCTIYGSYSEVAGGAIFVDGASVTLQHSVISLNGRDAAPDDKVHGGAISVASAALNNSLKVDVDNCRFEYNTGPGRGAALWCGPHTTCKVSRSSFYANKGYKGVFAVDALGSAELTNVSFQSNEGFDVGGVIHSLGGLQLLHVSVTTSNNIEPDKYPAVYVNGPTKFINSVLSANGQDLNALDCLRGTAAQMELVVATTISTKPASSALVASYLPGGQAFGCIANSQVQAPAVLAPPKPLAPLGPVLKVMNWASIPIGAPALDGADFDWCQAAGADMRGLPRPQGVGCDRGAVEVAQP